LILLYFSMIFADFIAPYSPTETFKNHPYQQPELRWYSKLLGFGPQVQKYVLVDRVAWKYARIKNEYVRIHFFVKGSAYKLFGIIPMDLHLFGTSENYDDSEDQHYPVFLFGADHMGRDIFSRIFYGSRISLTIGFFGIGISLVLAILFGGIAGFYGGIWDWVIMRFAEFFILIPGLYLILFLRSIIPRNLDSGQSFMLITIILAFVGWPGTARMIRGMVHSIKREDFIEVAKLQGIPSVVIIFKQIIPQMSSILIVSIALGIPGFILGETALSYLGLGIVDPAVSWGSMLNKEITTLANLKNFPWFLIPGFFILLTTLAFNFLGDLLRDLFDPYFREKS
jgi:peptide/nickel transport system permease protein